MAVQTPLIPLLSHYLTKTLVSIQYGKLPLSRTDFSVFILIVSFCSLVTENFEAFDVSTLKHGDHEQSKR